MKDLSSLLRRLADVVDANGGELPEIFFDAPKENLMTPIQKGKQSDKDYARSLVRNLLYGR